MIAPRQDEVQARFLDPSLTWRLLGYVRPYRGHVLLSLVVLLSMAVLLNYLPVLMKSAIDRYLAAGSEVLTADERLRGLVRIAGLYLGLAATGFAVQFLQSYLMAWVGQNIISSIRIDVFRKVLRMPLRFFDQTPVGRLMTRVISDVEAMQRLVTDGLVGLAADVFMLAVTTGFMIYVSPRLALTLFLVLPVLVGGLTYINYKLRGAQRGVRRLQAALNSFMQEAITGMTTIQLFNRERASLRLFEHHNRNLQKGYDTTVRWLSIYFPMLEVMRGLAVVLVLIAGGLSILRGSTDVTIGTLVAFLAYIRAFFQPLEALSDKSSMFQQAMASSERIFALLDTDEEIRDPAKPLSLAPFRGQVEFRNVWFAYSGEDWVLRDVAFRIEAGESVALVGATGAGKSSVIGVLSRFYDVQRGAVLIDGKDVRDLRQAELRRCMGIVLQDPFVFSESVAENLRLGRPDISRDRIVEAAKQVNAHAFIESLPQGYETVLGERGGTLSSGQKQLLALARTLVQNPEVLLILDEATANVDTYTENLIRDALQTVIQNRTCIIIAHRLSTIRHVDRIIVMRQGEIIETGPHTELVAANGYYSRLYELMSHEATEQ